MSQSRELELYFTLIEEFPELFSQPGDNGGIEIIVNLEEIAYEIDLIRQRGSAVPMIGLLVDDPWYYVIRDLVRFPNGYVGGYIRFINKKSLQGGVNVVMLTKRGEDFFLINHYRHEERKWSWEFPRGFGEPGLSGEECARKEIDEELHITGVDLIQLQLEKEGYSGGTAYFWAEIPADAPIKVDSDEGVNGGTWLARETLEAWIRDGKIWDRFTTKVYLYLLLREKKEASEMVQNRVTK